MNYSSAVGITRTWAETFAPVRIIGASGSIRGFMGSNPNARTEIPIIWGRFFTHLTEVATVINDQVHGNTTNKTMYGAMFAGQDCELYVAGIEVEAATKVPQDLTEYRLPGGEYFVAEFIGEMSEFPTAIASTYQLHVGKCGKTIDQRPHLEIYPKGFDQRSSTARALIAVPVA